MSQFDIGAVHVFRKPPGHPSWVLSEVHPVMWFTNQDERLAIQHGKVWTAGGVLVPKKDLPAWFAEAVAKANPAALAECGYKAATEPEQTALSKSRAKRLAAQQAPVEAASAE